MSDFQDMLKSDAENLFSNPDEFGETVLFTPRTPATGNIARNVNAVVFRNAPEKGAATPRLMINKTRVKISKSLLIVKPVVDGDTITIDGAAKTIVKIDDESDPGFWNLTVN